MEQVAMGRVQLDGVEAHALRTQSRRHKVFDEPLYFLNRQLVRNVPALPERYGRRRHGLPGRLARAEGLAAFERRVRGGLAAGVRELDADRVAGYFPES